MKTTTKRLFAALALLLAFALVFTACGGEQSSGGSEDDKDGNTDGENNGDGNGDAENDDWENSDDTEAAQNVTYTRDGNYIYFGEYPQTVKADDVRIGKTMDARGYYRGSDGAYYAKVTATPRYEEDDRFSTGDSVTEGSVYYFKVEPIRWRILTESGDTALVLCDSIIEAKAYDADANNNYAESDIRAWLNAEFYQTAFNTLQKELINTELVDNSSSTTCNKHHFNGIENPYACEDTNDKVFLLSYADVTDPSYGFQQGIVYDATREKRVTDYARAIGVETSESSGYVNGFWWLRSPVGSEWWNDLAYMVSPDSVVDSYPVPHDKFGVVPALEFCLR